MVMMKIRASAIEYRGSLSLLVQRSNQESTSLNLSIARLHAHFIGYLASSPVFVVLDENLTRPTRGLAP